MNDKIGEEPFWVNQFLKEADAMSREDVAQLLNYVPGTRDQIRGDMELSARMTNLYARTVKIVSATRKKPLDRHAQRMCRTAQMICGTVFEQHFPDLLDRHFRVMLGENGKACIVLIDAIAKAA